MKQKLTVLILAACLATSTGFAQSAAQLLEKGIFAQETEGNLDNAIAIYRQLINGNPTQRELGAQAQYRLAQKEIWPALPRSSSASHEIMPTTRT